MSPLKDLISQDIFIFGSAIAVAIIMLSFSMLVTWLGLIPARHSNEVIQGKEELLPLLLVF